MANDIKGKIDELKGELISEIGDAYRNRHELGEVVELGFVNNGTEYISLSGDEDYIEIEVSYEEDGLIYEDTEGLEIQDVETLRCILEILES